MNFVQTSRQAPDVKGHEDRLPGKVRNAIAAEEKRVRERRGGPRRILVVGGSGYIGIPLITHLLGQGHLVRNLDLAVYGHAGASIGLLQHPAYEHRYGDMGDAATAERALDDVSDVVILAGLVGDPITKAFPDEAHTINDVALGSFIERLAGRGLDKVIFVSTCSNYGMIAEDETADENFELRPLSLYAKSKVAAESHLLSLKGKVDYHPTILRFATAFGLAPRMRFDLTVNEFTRELCVGRELEVYDAHTWRPYCHVLDFARLIDRVLRFPVEAVSFEVFNAGGDRNNHTKKQIVDLVCERVPGARVKIGGTSSDGRNYRVDFAKVREKLFFEPRYDVADGIDEIVRAIGLGLLDDVEERRTFYGNYALPGLFTKPPSPARACVREEA